MANTQDIDIIIKAQDQATAQIKKVQASIKDLETKTIQAAQKTQDASNKMTSAFSGVWGIVAKVVAAVGVFEGAKGLLKLTSDVEQAKISFETLLGTQDAALKMLKDIDTFAAKTPFEKTNLTPLVQQLIGMGFAANSTLPIIQVLGDSMAALGRGQDDLNGVVLALGQIQTKGKVSAEELMQLAERGLPVFQILEQKLGLTKKQLGDIWNAGISSAQGINALLTGLNEKFGVAMQKQAQTLQGQWSNLLDNIKATVGNAWQGINDQLKGWLSKINAFFDANRPIIAKFASDILQFIGSALEGVGLAFWAVSNLVGEVLAGITGDTQKSTSSQAKSWSMLVMVISNGVQVAGLIISTFINSAIGGFKILYSVGTSVMDTVVGAVGSIVLTAVNTIINVVNTGIEALNKLIVFAGGTAIKTIGTLDGYIKKSNNFIKDSWKGSAQEIDQAWGEMTTNIWKDTATVVNNMVANMEKYQDGASTAGTQTSDLAGRINGYLDTIKNVTGAAGEAASKTAASTKEQREELKKLKQTAEDSIKPIIEKIKDEGKDIDSTKQKLREKAAEWKAYKAEGIKAISDITNEINKLKLEASNISIKINQQKDENLAQRLVEVNSEIKDITEQVNNKKAEGNYYSVETIELENKIIALQKERDFIQSSAPQKVIEEITAYNNLSRAQQIIADAKKQEATQLEENAKKTQIALEKQMILQAQVTQNGVNDLKIITGLKDGVMTASVETQKGKITEIKDYENIVLATEIANKQAAYKQDVETLVTTLADKTTAQKKHLDEVQTLYREYNANLSHDTDLTAKKMIASLASVNASLKQTIALKEKAGITGTLPGSGQATTNIAGARADGGPVNAGSTYIVWERGPEYFTPNQSGTIIPNTGNTSININLGGVTVRSDADIKTLVSTIKDELARSLQLYKQGIL